MYNTTKRYLDTTNINGTTTYEEPIKQNVYYDDRTSRK